MSQKISQLPAVIAANISDTDIVPIVASNITSKVTVANLRTKLGTQPPTGGRTVTDAFTYLTNNAVYNVKDWGAFGDGVTNDTAAITAAIAAASAFASANTLGAVVRFPAGNYKIVSTITVSQDRVNLIGDGVRATTITFVPTANGDAFLLSKASTGIAHNTIKGFAFTSPDTTYVKTAIHVIDADSYTIEDIGIMSTTWHNGANTCVGIYVQGRDFGWYRNIVLSTNRPIVIGIIPSPHTPGGISIDHHNFHNIYLISDNATSAVIEIETGVLLSQVSFTGTQSWIGGGDALRWVDTTSAAVSNGLLIENVRTEQTFDSTKYFLNIQHNQRLQGLVVRGGQVGDRRGIYLRKVDRVRLDGFWYTAGTEGLNVDATVRGISGDACFWQTTTTATLTGQRLMFATSTVGGEALSPSFEYDVGTAGARTWVGDSYDWTPVLNGFTQVLGAGAITVTGKVHQIGALIYWEATINCTGGATIASVANTSYISGHPTAAVDSTCTAVSDTTVNLGIGYTTGNATLTPGWAARTGKIIISGSFRW